MRGGGAPPATTTRRGVVTFEIYRTKFLENLVNHSFLASVCLSALQEVSVCRALAERALLCVVCRCACSLCCRQHASVCPYACLRWSPNHTAFDLSCTVFTIFCASIITTSDKGPNSCIT